MFYDMWQKSKQFYYYYEKYLLLPFYINLNGLSL